MVEHGVTGFLAPCGDHETLAKHTLTVLRDQEATKACVKAAKLRLEKYQWPAVAPQWIELYEGLKT